MKTAFLNEDLEVVYMKQQEGLSSSGDEHLVCKLKKSIYGLKQLALKWYLKFHDVTSFFWICKEHYGSMYIPEGQWE